VDDMIDPDTITAGDDQTIPGVGPASTPAVAGGAAVSTDGGAAVSTDGGSALGPTTAPAESGRRADSLLTPDVTGGSEGFAPTPGGTLLAPDVTPDDPESNLGS
jgi:hypothetical protein